MVEEMLILLVQKLINKKDAKPIPSQPKNIIKKLSAVTKISIKKVNKLKYPINLPWWGSLLIYSVEYKCTNEDTPVTTNNIVVDKGSK